MKNRAYVASILFVAASTLTCGCALTGKGDALTIRYFTPETVKPELTSATAGSAPSDNNNRTLSLELGRTTSGSHLREKIAYRDAAYEVGYYDDRRWTERPDVYVRRELARTLFEEHGVRRSIAAQSPVLDVEVISFEEIRGKTTIARIQLRMMVHDDREALFEKTITIDRPLTNSSIDALIHAMSEALEAATEEVAKNTEQVLRTHLSAAASSTPK